MSGLWIQDNGAGGSGTGAVQVQGTAASGAAPVGNPVLSGVIATAADPTYIEGSVDPLSVNLNGYQRAILGAGSNIIGSVLGRTSKVAVTPTVTASSAYAAGNEVGGLMTFANVFDAANSGILQSITVKCLSVQTTPLNLYLFTTNPTNSTWTDKTGPAINAADIPYMRGPFTFGYPDSGLGTCTIWELDAIAAAIVASSTSLYGILTCTATPTFASTSGITVSLTVLKD